MNKYIVLLLCLLMAVPLMAQKTERRQMVQGNKLYEEEKYTEAEIAYRKALEEKTESARVKMNLGDALYNQQKFNEALEQYQLLAADENLDNDLQADAFHNIGNVMMQAQDYGKAVEAYRQSLIRRPGDDQTRYNLAMAQALLKQQQEQQQQQDQQQEQQQDKQDQQQQEQQQQQQQQEQEQEQQQQNKQQEQQPQDAQEQISKEQAQQLLDALMQDEAEVQDKVKQLQMQQSQGKKIDKDW